jgi:hypothetical protein
MEEEGIIEGVQLVFLLAGRLGAVGKPGYK